MIELLLLLAGAADDGLPFFTRDEPHLEDARDAADNGDADVALEHARTAQPATDDERAIVEYDVAQILVVRARADAKAAAATTTTKPQQPPAAPAPPKLDDARTGFERAAGLAHDKRIASEAFLAAGNAALEMGKLEEAISDLRRALIADRHNVRARRNLQRALELKQQQPPPPEDGDGGNDVDDKKKKDEQKEGEDGAPKDGDQQKPGDKDKQEGKQDDKNGDKKDGPKPADDGKGDEEKEKQKEQEKKEAGAQPQKKPTSKEEAKRLLQGIRSRERPLTPLEMRGTEKKRAAEGKDW